jgi:hypothetical protein
LPAPRAGAFTGKRGSIRTVPVNHSLGPFPDGCEPLRLICIVVSDIGLQKARLVWQSQSQIAQIWPAKSGDHLTDSNTPH